MEQCHAPELPCNYIDPLLKSSCLQVKHTIYGVILRGKTPFQMDAYNNTKNDGLILALFSKATLSSDEDSNDDNVDIKMLSTINMHGLVQLFENFFIIQKYNFVRLLAYTYEVRKEILKLINIKFV